MSDRPTLYVLYERVMAARRSLPIGKVIVHHASGGVYEVTGFSIREADGEVLVNYSTGLVPFSRPYSEVMEMLYEGKMERRFIRTDYQGDAGRA